MATGETVQMAGTEGEAGAGTLMGHEADTTTTITGGECSTVEGELVAGEGLGSEEGGRGKGRTRREAVSSNRQRFKCFKGT